MTICTYLTTNIRWSYPTYLCPALPYQKFQTVSFSFWFLVSFKYFLTVLRWWKVNAGGAGVRTVSSGLPSELLVLMENVAPSFHPSLFTALTPNCAFVAGAHISGHSFLLLLLLFLHQPLLFVCCAEKWTLTGANTKHQPSDRLLRLILLQAVQKKLNLSDLRTEKLRGSDRKLRLSGVDAHSQLTTSRSKYRGDTV